MYRQDLYFGSGDILLDEAQQGIVFFYHAEQQKQLKLIHEKFKEDINQYLQDCSSTLEGMEAHHIELKGTVEKQSMENLIVVSVDFSLLFQCIIAMF